MELPRREKIDMSDNDRQRDYLLKLLAREGGAVLSQAYLYAKNLADYGIDVTEKWSTATQQAEALDRAYRKGWRDGAERRATDGIGD